MARHWAPVKMATDKLPEAKIKTLGNVMVNMKLGALVFKLIFTKAEAKAQTLGDRADTLAQVETKTLSNTEVEAYLLQRAG